MLDPETRRKHRWLIDNYLNPALGKWPIAQITTQQLLPVLKRIEQDGWRFHSQRGSHRQYKHPTKPGRVTVPGKPSDDLSPGMERSIKKQAGLQ